MNWETLNSRSYTPYSKKQRSCLVQGKSGKFYIGVRIENVSYPLTISAIQAGCSICLSEGDTPLKLLFPDTDFDQLEFWKKELGLEINVVSNISHIKPEDLSKIKSSDERSDLRDLLEKALTPNSDFPVSALLYTETGMYEGVNIEFSDWTLGLCAERVALAKCIANGDTELTDIAVHTKYGEVSSPCGACRQVIIEHLPLNKIRLYHADNSMSEHFSIDLLPFSFTSGALRK